MLDIIRGNNGIIISCKLYRGKHCVVVNIMLGKHNGMGFIEIFV